MTDQAASARSNGATVALWVVQVLAAAAFAMFGVLKLTGSPDAVAIFHDMGTQAWMPYLIGVIEVVAAVALLVPRLAGPVSVGLVVLLVGAVLSHAIWGGTAVPALMGLVLAAAVAWGRRESTKELWAAVAGA